MAEITDIKDRAPNPALIERLETMLEQAKKGELRAIVYVSGWDDDYWSQSWVLDNRNTHLRMAGALSMLQHEVLTNEQFRDEDSPLSRAFDD